MAKNQISDIIKSASREIIANTKAFIDAIDSDNLSDDTVSLMYNGEKTHCNREEYHTLKAQHKTTKTEMKSQIKELTAQLKTKTAASIENEAE